MTPSLDDLYLFTAVAHTGGLIRGAKSLGLPKSTVSRCLAQLERDVGAKLINRDARHFELTEIGIAYAEQAQRMVDAYSEAQEFLAQQEAKPSGVLKVSMPADFAIFFLAEAIASFSKIYPNVTLDIDASPQVVNMIGERFDLAIRMGKLPDSSLIAKPLTSLARHFYASKVFLKMHGMPKSLDELSELPFIALQTQSMANAAQSIQLKKGAMFLPKTAVKTNSIGLMRSLAVEGAGVIALPDVMATAPLIRLLPEIELTPAEAHVVLPQRQWVPTKTRAFMEHIQAYCVTAALVR